MHQCAFMEADSKKVHEPTLAFGTERVRADRNGRGSNNSNNNQDMGHQHPFGNHFDTARQGHPFDLTRLKNSTAISPFV